MERSGLTFEHLVWKWSKIAAQKKKFFFADFALVHPPMASVLLSASVERCFFSRMQDFFLKINHATSSNLYRFFYPHRLRELVSPVCGIFFSLLLFSVITMTLNILYGTNKYTPQVPIMGVKE